MSLDSPDNDDAVTRYRIEDGAAAEGIATHDDDEATGPWPPLWWAVHAPETYALAGLAFALTAMWFLSAAFELTSVILIRHRGHGITANYQVDAGMRIALAVIATLFAVRSIKLEDDDSSWSAPVARVTLIICALAIVLALVTIFAAHTGSEPGNGGFTG